MATMPKDQNEPVPEKRRFILFIAEGEPNSLQAQQNIEAILAGVDCNYELRISDVFDEFELAAQHDVLVIPCLLMLQPEPATRVIGTMKNQDKVRRALRLE